jgi:hypothetical protein
MRPGLSKGYTTGLRDQDQSPATKALLSNDFASGTVFLLCKAY